MRSDFFVNHWLSCRKRFHSNSSVFLNYMSQLFECIKNLRIFNTQINPEVLLRSTIWGFLFSLQVTSYCEISNFLLSSHLLFESFYVPILNPQGSISDSQAFTTLPTRGSYVLYTLTISLDDQTNKTHIAIPKTPDHNHHNRLNQGTRTNMDRWNLSSNINKSGINVSPFWLYRGILSRL